MRHRTVGGPALLAALVLGAPGCAAPGLVGARPVATVGLEPSAAVSAIGGGTTGGGLRREFMGMPRPGALLGMGALLVLLSPVVVVYLLLWTPVRVLRERA